VPRIAIHWQREELTVDYPPTVDEAEARGLVGACLDSGKVPPPGERRRWAGMVETPAGRFRVTFVRDTVTITPEGEAVCE